LALGSAAYLFGRVTGNSHRGGSACAAAVALLARELRLGRDSLRREIRNSGDVAAITKLMPIDHVLLGDFAVDADFAKVLIQEVGPGIRTVVECGSGMSTLLIATILEANGGEGRVVSLEHDARWASRTQELLGAAGLSHRAHVVYAPLCRQRVGQELVSWFALGGHAKHRELDLPRGSVDLLLVDGPPTASPLARWPAPHVFRPHLSKDFTILLDDGRRSGERQVVNRWVTELGPVRLFWVDTVKGAWIIKADSSPRGRTASSVLKQAARRVNPMPSGFGLTPVER
jgi:hypothetical protein